MEFPFRRKFHILNDSNDKLNPSTPQNQLMSRRPHQRNHSAYHTFQFQTVSRREMTFPEAIVGTELMQMVEMVQICSFDILRLVSHTILRFPTEIFRLIYVVDVLCMAYI